MFFLSSSLWSSLVTLLAPDKARVVGGLTELSYDGTMDPERSRDRLETLADLIEDHRKKQQQQMNKRALKLFGRGRCKQRLWSLILQHSALGCSYKVRSCQYVCIFFTCSLTRYQKIVLLPVKKSHWDSKQNAHSQNGHQTSHNKEITPLFLQVLCVSEKS